MNRKNCFMNEDRECDGSCPAYSTDCRLLMAVNMATCLVASISKALEALVEGVKSPNKTVYPKSAPPPEV